MRRLAVAAIVLVPILLAGTASAAGLSSLRVTSASAQVQAYQPGAGGVTYDESLVPAGAQLAVLGFSGTTSSTVLLHTRGLLPSRQYGAHVHVKPCGASPSDSGPHFQNEIDPVQPSVDPAYANPRNEVWLDFTTDEQGGGVVSANVPWAFGDRTASSVVVHATSTHTEPGHAGTAGARLACLNVTF
jgi:superoxide dismutase, Cu-Zn family